MKNLNELNNFRRVHPLRGIGDSCGGYFEVPYLLTGMFIRVIASSGEGWDHVSVSLPNRCPNWLEMSYIKNLFFKSDEWAVEYHPPKSENINVHQYCLHLWRCQNQNFPIPPKEFV